MENNNIDKHFRKLSEQEQPTSFKNSEKVWDKIEQKLDQQPTRKKLTVWKYAGIAAAVLLFVTLGITLFDQSSKVMPSVEDNQKVIVNEEKAKEIIQEQTDSVEDVYVYEEPKKVTPNRVQDEKVFMEVEVKKDPALRTSQDDFDDYTTSGRADREANYERGELKLDRAQTGSAEKSSSKRSASVDRYTNNEWVVTNYQSVDKKQSASAVNTVSSKTIEGRPNPSLIQALQGQVAGLNITTGSGQPGTDYTAVILRGLGSINKIEPLFIVDGVPVSADTFRAMNPNDIENIKILKGAEATAFYGSRGAKGVVDITSKKGAKRESAVENPLIKIDTESYENFVENQFESAVSNPVSTFSIDVDNASYTNIRRFLNNGQTVPKDAVRIEEMINFFKYDYAQPTGKHPFAIHTEYSDAPWNKKHKLLRIALKGKEIPTDKLPKSNFVFLVDISGSMSNYNKLPLLKSSMKVLLDELRPDDRVSIVYYASGVGVLLEPTKAANKQKIIYAIDNMSAGGGTSGEAGLELAYKMAEKNFIKNGNNRIILATDGDFNIGKSTDEDMQKLIEEKRKTGVYLTCLGFGMGNYKDSKLMTLSEKGNGNYAYIDNIQEANRFLGKEFKGSMFAIAKDVKIQIEFNPKHVQSYRLIGYESRKLRNEDFTNDAIDAGELGSGHTVTALYEVIPAGVESQFFTPSSELKYSQNIVSDIFQNELATVKFRYKKPGHEKSIEMVETVKNKRVALNRSSKDFRFATAVAWFGLKLRDSQLITDKETKNIADLAKQGLQNDDDGYKAEFIRLVKSTQ